MVVTIPNAVDRTRVLASLASLEGASRALSLDQHDHTVRFVQDSLLLATVQLRLALGLQLNLDEDLASAE